MVVLKPGKGGNVIKRKRGRPRMSEYMPVVALSQDKTPHIRSVLRTPLHPDELGQILGDTDPPYFGILDEDEGAADRTLTTPSAEDRALFRTFHRPMPHQVDLGPQNLAIRSRMAVHFGQKYTVDAWYRSAYPAEYTCGEYLCVCCHCLQYSTSDLVAERHLLKCSQRNPPGREVYRDGNLSVWEVDGSLASLYCQNICLLAKLFLKSKSLHRDVAPFFFYVLTEQVDDQGPRFVGYFSKQKAHTLFESSEPIESVACILTMPFVHNKGYGQFLIDFSYMLTRMQKSTGGPETPLSLLGERAFKKSWQRTVCRLVASHIRSNTEFTLASLSAETGIKIDHIVYTFEDLGWLHISHGKLSLNINEAHLNEMNSMYESLTGPALKEDKVLWAPVFAD